MPNKLKMPVEITMKNKYESQIDPWEYKSYDVWINEESFSENKLAVSFGETWVS
jgi:hypothetical protein